MGKIYCAGRVGDDVGTSADCGSVTGLADVPGMRGDG
jgi:hypothetical protein